MMHRKAKTEITTASRLFLHPIDFLKDKLGIEKFDRLYVLLLFLSVVTILIILRLFTLQVLDYNFYAALASGEHEIQSILHADRGQILTHDYQSGEDIPVATNKAYMQVYAVPKDITDPTDEADKLAPFVKETKDELMPLLDKPGDPYELIESKVSKERFEKIQALNLPGINGVEEMHRYYVDDNIGSHIIGFLGNKDEKATGVYGIEGYFNTALSGSEGYFSSEKDVAGRWIVLSDQKVQQAVNGADIVLTIDHTIQYVACQKLDEAVQNYGADGGALVVMDPFTGKVLAMCSAPDFNLNYYYDVDSAATYNNKAIFDAYEPGSVFKPMIMSAGIDLGYVTPESTYVDTGSVDIDDFTIHNADDHVYGEQNMANVLEYSINTGMIYVASKIGHQNFRDYVQRFGFGELTGIELQTESPGNITSLDKSSDVYTATASFGQGITATPLQITAAYAAIANGGKLMKPYIVDEIHYADGRVEKRQPTEIRQVLSSRAAVLMTGMLTSVVSNGHGTHAQVPGYYVAGKTGTAQIAGSNGHYLETATNHSFAGYAPADNPKFVMMIKLENPKAADYSASTAAPVFGELAKFILNYYSVPPDYNP